MNKYDEYISKYNDLSTESDYIEYCNSVVNLFANEIQGISKNKPYISPLTGERTNCLTNEEYAKLLKEKLELKKNNDIYELEKLRLQAEISKASIQVTATGGNANANSTSNALSTVTVTLDQTVNTINEIPSDILSDEEKEELEEKLSALEVARNSGDKGKLSSKVGNVLKYIADKGIEVGIASLPYLGEISKLIQTM